MLTSARTDESVAASPLTVVFQRAGFGAATHVVNAVLLTAVLSATNSCFYASSRMLLALARNGQAPSVFGWVTSRGVPVPALLYVHPRPLRIYGADVPRLVGSPSASRSSRS